MTCERIFFDSSFIANCDFDFGEEKVSIEFVENNSYKFDEYDWEILSRNPTLTEDFIERFIGNLHLGDICRLNKLTESFIEKHSDKLYPYFYFLCLNKSLTESFFEKHLDLINWEALSDNQTISQSFFEKYGKLDTNNKINWKTLSENPTLTEDFVEKYINKINWLHLGWNLGISEKFFEKHIDLIEWQSLSQNPNISEAFFEKYGKLTDSEETCLVNWELLSCNRNMTEAFFEKYIDYISWYHLNYDAVSQEFLERHYDNINWCSLSSFGHDDFFRKHVEKMNPEHYPEQLKLY